MKAKWVFQKDMSPRDCQVCKILMIQGNLNRSNSAFLCDSYFVAYHLNKKGLRPLTQLGSFQSWNGIQEIIISGWNVLKEILRPLFKGNPWEVRI